MTQNSSNDPLPPQIAHSGADTQCLEVLRDVCQHVSPGVAYPAIVDAYLAARHHDSALPTIAEAAAHLGLEVASRPLDDVVGARDGRPLAAVARAREGWIVVTRLEGRRPHVRRLWIGGGERSVPRTHRQLSAIASEAQSWLVFSARRAYATGAEHAAPWQRVRALARLERPDVKAVIAFAVAVSILSLLTPVAIQTLVNTIAFGTVLQPLVLLSLALMLGLGLAAVLSALEAYTVEVLQRRFLVRIAEDLAERMPRAAASARDSKDLVELNNRFFDVITVQKAGSQLLLDGLALALQTIAGLTVISIYHPYLFAFALFLVLILAIVFLRARGATKTAVLESKAKFQVGAWLDELARNPAAFRGHAGRRFAASELRSRAGAYLQRRRDHFRHILTILGGGLAVGVFSVVSLLTVGGWLVIEGELTLGQLVAAELIMSSVAIGFGKLGSLAEKTFDLAAALDKIGKLFDVPVEPVGGEPLTGDQPLAVTARDISVVSCKARVASGLSLDIDAGERVAVVADDLKRTALLQTLAGLRPVGDGSITYSGVLHPDPDDMGDAVIYVSDEPLLGGTVLDNLRIRTPALSREAARDLIDVVGLHKAVDRLDNGLDTAILPTGGPFTRRETRRLRLAAALAVSPRLLILDESLDDLGLSAPEKQKLLDFILDPASPFTVILASADAEVLERCDRKLDLAAEAN